MQAFICVTCGTQFAPGEQPPASCPICADDRQYIGHAGQRWTTMAELRADHRNEFWEVDSRLTAIATTPRVAIGQQAHLIQAAAGNVLWDCISLLDHPTVEAVRKRGGIAAIVISHPHFFSSMVDWSRAFEVPVYLHAEHRPWVMRPDDDAIVYWEGEQRPIVPGVTAIRCGGHFPGSTTLHWAEGAGGKGSLFTSDTIYVVSDRRWVSFMYSYPNLIPMDAATVRRIVAAVEPFAFDRLYSSWRETIVAQDAKAAVRRSAERYIAHITG